MLAIISMIPGMIQGENTEEQRLELLINQENTKDKCKERKKGKEETRGRGDRKEKKSPKICMESQKTPKSQSNLKKKEQSWRHHTF